MMAVADLHTSGDEVFEPQPGYSSVESTQEAEEQERAVTAKKEKKPIRSSS